MKSIAGALVALLMLSSAVHAGSDSEAIEAANRSWEAAYNSGDAAGLAALYTSDGALLPPGGTRVEGRQAITDFWAGAMASGLANVRLETVELEVLGDFATNVGNLAATVPAEDGSTVPVTGKFIVVWKRDGDTWRLHRDIWNMNP